MNKDASHALNPGTLLQNGKYRIIRFISSGGFGCTYEAVHTLFRERVAIKELYVGDCCNRDPFTGHVTVATLSKKPLIEKLHRKFIDEACAIRHLSHPGIIRVTDVFEENSTAYYVMDYVDGCSLQEMAQRCGGPMPEAEAVGYIRQVCDSLAYVHSTGRLHLDIKPGNIMVTSAGRAILIDFGTSKQYDEANGQNTSTIVGHTPGYASIEQSSNTVRSFTPASDIYSLGATLYRLLSGSVPPDASAISSGTVDLPPLPSTVSLPVRRAVQAAMQIRITDRPATVGLFLALLNGRRPDSPSTGSFPAADHSDDSTVVADATAKRAKELHTKRTPDYIDDNYVERIRASELPSSDDLIPNDDSDSSESKKKTRTILWTICIAILIIGNIFLIASRSCRNNHYGDSKVEAMIRAHEARKDSLAAIAAKQEADSIAKVDSIAEIEAKAIADSVALLRSREHDRVYITKRKSSSPNFRDRYVGTPNTAKKNP